MPLSDFPLRPVREQDAALVATHRFPEPWGDEARLTSVRAGYALWLERVIAQGRYVGFLAETQGRVAAGAGAVLLDWGATWIDPNPVKARLVNVFTAPEFRRQGLARTLVAETLAALRGQGVRSVNLATTDAAQALYASLGFKPRPGEFGIQLA